MNRTIDNPNFRPGTQTEAKEVVFSFMEAGKKTAALGDMICWMAAIKFVAEKYNYVNGHLIVPKFFIELATNVLREFPHWRVHSQVPDRLADGTPLRMPVANPVNATMMHLIDLGFLYFCGMLPPEGAKLYPRLDLEDIPSDDGLGSYAVMTPGATAKNRAMPASVYNAVCDHLILKGITPVHMGVTNMSNRSIQPEFNSDYDFSKGVNLIDQTTLLSAAKIMEGAKMVIGIDNGLLHLAGMTDVAILYGFTMAGPEQRRIHRAYGHTVELYADKAKLPCLFCQEHVRFFTNHDFSNCIYKENEPACVKALNAESWITNIDTVLAGG